MNGLDERSYKPTNWKHLQPHTISISNMHLVTTTKLKLSSDGFWNEAPFSTGWAKQFSGGRWVSNKYISLLEGTGVSSLVGYTCHDKGSLRCVWYLGMLGGGVKLGSDLRARPSAAVALEEVSRELVELERWIEKNKTISSSAWMFFMPKTPTGF